MIHSSFFEVEKIDFGGKKPESIVRGGRQLLPLAIEAFQAANIRQIGVIGWGSQGPAQAQNLRDSLAASDIKVKVGLRRGSKSAEAARKAGFTEENGTLGEMFKVVAESDLVILLIADCGQVDHYKNIFAKMRPHATLGLSHGFLLGWLQSQGHEFPKHINVVAVCPKGMGPSVRRLYEQGSGINCSICVQQATRRMTRAKGARRAHRESLAAAKQRATDIALAWAVAIGAPTIFETTLDMERRSDLVGERFVLLGAVHGIVEVLYRYFFSIGYGKTEAFRAVVENITGPISQVISRAGLRGLYEQFTEQADRRRFEQAYCAAYGPMLDLVAEIYREVESHNEVRSVVLAGETPRHKIGDTYLWKQVAVHAREMRGHEETPLKIEPVTAGIYLAAMMAQIDLFLEKNHCFSEICNETVIEAVDSLLPFMHKRGIDFMVDNCSTTAQRGARRWAPICDHRIMQLVLGRIDTPAESATIQQFLNHPAHRALEICASMRPPIDIALV